MFNLISKKKLLKAAIEVYRLEDTAFALSEQDLFFRMGHANGLEYLCYRLGCDLTGSIKELNKGVSEDA